MKVLGHRIKNYYTAIHTPLYSEEKNDFEFLEENYRCVQLMNIICKRLRVYTLHNSKKSSNS